MRVLRFFYLALSSFRLVSFRGFPPSSTLARFSFLLAPPPFRHPPSFSSLQLLSLFRRLVPLYSRSIFRSCLSSETFLLRHAYTPFGISASFAFTDFPSFTAARSPLFLRPPSFALSLPPSLSLLYHLHYRLSLCLAIARPSSSSVVFLSLSSSFFSSSFAQILSALPGRLFAARSPRLFRVAGCPSSEPRLRLFPFYSLPSCWLPWPRVRYTVARGTRGRSLRLAHPQHPLESGLPWKTVLSSS